MTTFFDHAAHRLTWCAICAQHTVPDTEHYTCVVCADPGLDVPKPPKAVVRIARIPGPQAISRLAAGFAEAWAGRR